MFKDVLRDYIKSGHPTRQDAQRRIDYGVASGQLTPDDAAELVGLLDDSTVLVGVWDAITALAERMAAQEAKGRDPDLPDDVEDWVPPSGAHDAPNIGDKRRYEGVVYVSKMDGNPTVPGSDPRYWEVVA
ncbi:hypothetical protein LJC74_01650 [Eubacteriales bacterium OttesenSCG-928-A19]|nr:hypothetical protein [Eubacteriales bacterium OttesenSCG-928-A19]